MTDLAQIAARLTEAQRRVVLALANSPKAGLSDDKIFVDYQRAGCRRRDTRAKLTNAGVTEPYRSGPVVMWSMIRLTPLGLSLAQYLRSQANG